MSDPGQEPIRRRLGPISYRSESKVTTMKPTADVEGGGIGEASGPFVGTPKKERELRRLGLSAWAGIGVLVIVLGVVLVSPFVVLLGVVVLLVIYFASRRNRTEARLRRQGSEKRGV